MKRAPSRPRDVSKRPRTMDERFDRMKAELDRYDAAIAKHAPTIVRLAEAALAALQALIDAEREAGSEINESSPLFGGTQPSLEDAEAAITIALNMAREA
jgi:hypothetical protein